MDLAEFREKYPEYDHASDDDLSRALHKRHYSHVPYKTFRGKFNPPGWVDTVQSSFQKAGYRMGTATGGIRQSHAEDVVEGIDELQAMGTGEKFRQMNFGEDLINDAPPPPSEEGSFLDRMESKRAEVLSDMQERAREEVEVGKHIGAEFRALYEGESVDYPIERGDRMLSTERGKYYVSHTVESLFGSMLPALAVGAATRSPKLAASTMFPVVYGEEYSNRRAEGMSPTDASVTAAFYGLSESLTEMIPLAKWLGSAGAPFLKRVFGTGMSEGLSEVLNEALQIGWDTGVLNEEMSLQEGIQQVTDAFIIGGMMGTTFGALPAGGKEGNTPGPDGRTPVDILREEAKKQRPVSDLVDEILEETGATEEERGPDLALEDIDPVSGIGTHREPSALEQTLEGIPEDTGPALGAIESLDVPPGTTVEMEDHAKAAEVKKAIDEAATTAATSPENKLPEPTDGQKEAGNYQKGHVQLHGMDVSIENPVGSERSGTDEDGKPWFITMEHHYGYIRRSEGSDGDQIDVFLGPDAENETFPVYVVNQKNESGGFDEHKVMVGFRTMLQAGEAYLSNYADDWLQRQGGALDVVEMSLPEFKTWLVESDTKKPVPSGFNEPEVTPEIEQPEVTVKPEISTNEPISEPTLQVEPTAAPEEPATSTPEPTLPLEEPADVSRETPNLVDEFTRRFQAGERFPSIADARKVAGTITGEKIEPGTPRAKAIDEAVEEAVVRTARDIVQKGETPDQTYDDLVDLYNRQPRFGTRTSTSVQQQAYSTPVPIAYVASQLGGINSETTVYEPTAGHGALLLEADTGNVSANELNDSRADSLERQDYTVTREDATTRTSRTVDVVIANPPFGAVDEGGTSKRWQPDPDNPAYSTTQIDHAIALKALESMKDDGRAVLILGSVKKTAIDERARSDAYHGKAKREFFLTLYGKYNVVDHFTISGGLYSKQGAGWPIDVIVIEGRGKSNLRLPAADVPPILRSFDELKEKLDGRRPVHPAERPDVPESSSRPSAEQDEGAGGVRSPGSTERPDTRPSGEGEGPSGGIRLPGGDVQPSEPVGQPAETGESDGVRDGSDTGEPGVGGTDNEPDLERRGGDSERGLESAPQPERGGDSGGGRSEGLGGQPDVLGQGGLTEQLENVTEADLDALINEVLAEGTPTPAEPDVPVEAQESAPVAESPPSAEESAKAAGKEVKAAVSEALDAIWEATGANRPGTLHSGPFAFGEEEYVRIVEHLKKALEHTVQAGKHLKDFIQAVFADVSRFPQDWVTNVLTPAVKQFVSEVQAGQIRIAGITVRQTRDPIDTSQSQVPYEPRSANTAVGTFVPANMRDAIDTALAKVEDKFGSVDQFIAEKLGYKLDEVQHHFSAEQVDAIAIAIANFDRGAAFIIGDQTGVGKGRVVAAMIRFGLRNGKIPIFVTEKPDLYADMHRDLKDIGMPDLSILATNSGLNLPLELADNGKVTKRLKNPKNELWNPILRDLANEANIGDYDVVFTTYTQMQTIEGDRTTRMDFMDAVGPGAMVILDESHNAGGTEKPQQQKEGKKEKLTRAKFVRDMVARAWNVLYSSATYAKRPSVMDLYYRTDMSLAVNSPEDLAPMIQKGGIPMQQVIATMLAKAGQYIRRERTFDGVIYDTVDAKTDIQSYEGFSKGLREIQNFSERYVADARDNIDDEVKGAGQAISADGSTGGAGATSLNFTSVMHNLVNQFLLSSKVNASVEEAIRALQNKENPGQVVITAANTMESFLKDEMKRLDLKTGDAYSPNFNDLLLRYLRRTREITIKQPFQKKGEKGEKHYLTDTELGEAGVAFYRKTEKMLRNLDFGDLSTSPFDEMRARLEAAGHTMGEITGRKHQLVKNETDTWTIRGRQHTPKTKRETIIGYQNGETDVLLINQSGSTGISLHASALNPEKGRRKRTMIIAQAEGNIDTHMQILGRVHRTGQVSTPDYIQLVADVPAERRPAAALAKKMASLNANTTGSRKGSMKTGDVLDFLNQYGDEVVASILDEDREINRKLAIALKEDEDGELIRDDAARLVSGRIPLLPVKEQEALYQMIETSYREYIDQLNETGQNTLEATVEDLDAILISREQVVDRIANIDSPFAEGAELEHMDVKITRKPHPTEKVLADLAKNIGTSVDGMSGDNVDKLKALNKLARDWMNDQSKEALDAFEDYKRGVLDDISDVDETSMDMDALESLREKNADRRKAQDVRLQEVRAQFLSRLRAVELGLPVTLATDEEVNPAIAVNITHTKGTANPLALSTWKVTFYLARGGQITVPLSRINSKVLVTPSPRGIAYGSTATIDAFDHLGKGREKRHIVTGNLPAGYDYVKGKGRIINFTDHQGRLRQGILMAKDFDPAKFADSKPINLNEADHVVTFVKKNGRPWTNDNAVMVRERIGGELRFSVERSKRVGGRYYLNQHVLDAAGKDFTSVGDNMRLDVDEATGKRVIQALIDVGAQFEARDNRDTAKAVTEEVRHSRGAKPTGQTVESIQGTLEQELGKRPIARLLEGGRVKIVQSDAHLPESVQHRDGGVRGAYDETTDTTYLVADNIDAENAMGVLLHELGVHYGLKKMLGAKLYDSVMGELRRMARTPEVAEARSRVPDDVSSKWIDEETLGYLVESRANHKLSPVKKMFAAVRAFLFRMGFTKKLDVDALVAMAQASVRRSSRGMRIQRRPSDFIPTALATSPMFSRKAAQDIDDPDLARLVDAASGPDKSRNWRKLLNGWRDRVRQSLFDPFHGLKIAERVGAGLDPIMHTLQSSYVAARMSTSTDTQLWVTLVKGALRWQNNVATFDPDSKGLLDILQPVEDKLNLWKAYMVAKRASRLKKEGRERLITPEMIAAGLALAERHPEFLTVSQEWADFNSRMLDFAEEAGVIDGSMRSLWEHDDYIPFYRVLEGEVGNPTSGQGLSHQQTIKRLKGGTAALNDVFENMLMNTAWLIQASMKNHAMQMAIENLEDSGLVRKAPMTWNKSLIPMSEIKRLAKQDTGPLADMRLALEDMGSELTDLEWEGFQKLWSMEVPKGDDVVMVRKNGKPVWYNVDESAPLLLRALTAMNQEAFGDWIKTLRLPKQWLTGFVTADPAFMLANWVRDTGAAFVLSRDGTKPLVSGIRGAIKTLKRDDDYWHMMAAGGGFRSGFVSAQDPEASAKMARKEMRHKDFRTTIIDSPRKLWDRWQDLGSIFENANRMALYEDAIKNGKSRLGAAFESKDFLDFTMRGDNTVVRFLVETIPFMNARLQGLYRLGRGAAENPKAFALKGMMIMAASIALWMINKDEDRYEELEEWDKDTYWHFWTGDQHWRIPKPFEVGIIFGTIPERILDAAYREGDDMAKVVLERIAWNAWQVFNFGSAPVPIQVTVEQIANRHFFTGRPIVGQREAGRLAGDQYSEWTHETSKLVGGAMGISPDRIDHFVRGFTGSIGEYAMGASDMLIRSIGDYPNEPSLRADEIPILKRFKRSDPPKSTKYRTEFWDLFKEIEKAQGSYRQAQQERNRDRRIELKQDHGGELRLRERFNKARAELQDISERRRKIHHNTNMSPEKKRGLIDNLIMRSNNIYKQTVELAEARGVKT